MRARWASTAVLALLGGASLASVGFIVVYLLDAGNTLLGLSLGAALGCLAAASIIAGKNLVPQIEEEEELGWEPHPGDQREVAEIVREGGEGITRRRLLITAAGGSAALTGAALALPAASLGPLLDTERLRETAWSTGRRLVDELGRPIIADEIELGSFATAFPQGADPKRLDAAVMVARLDPGELRLPEDRADWGPEGFVAYSKACTHAACAVSLFEHPRFEPTSPRARLVCPCHYSAFDVGGGGEVLAGPAGRPLPQLPLEITEEREILAAGELSGPPGPAWSGVRS